MKEASFVITNRAGQCRWCHCTHDRPCANGCGWADRTQTLCTECVPLDRAMHTTAGRRELAEFLQEHEFLVGAAMGPAAAPARGGTRRRRSRAR
jgi:hypothetical protein